MIKAFISYSPDTPQHLERVLALSSQLRREGVDCMLDQYVNGSPAEGWPIWRENQIREANFVLVVCSTGYFKEVSLKNHISWEQRITYQELYDEVQVDLSKYVLVQFENDPGFQPSLAMKSIPCFELHQPTGYESLYRFLTGQPYIERPDLGLQRKMPSKTMDADQENTQPQQELEKTLRRRADLMDQNEDLGGINEEILTLKRRLRKGRQLQRGVFLGRKRFLLNEKIGSGGFADVWKAYDRKEKRNVAVKILHGQYVRDKTRRDRFFRGAEKMKQLSDQSGIVKVLEPKEQEGDIHFFVMEYLPGGDLRSAVRAKEVQFFAGLEKVIQVGESLSKAHAIGLIHRDIKPANILLDNYGKPKLTDFDLVKAADTTGGTRTAGLGTFLYSGPEVLGSAKDAGPQGDVYGLAMTAIFILHGEDLPMQIIRYPDHFIAGFECNLEVKRVLVKGIEWDLEKRYPTVEKFCDSLRLAMGDNEAHAFPSLQRRNNIPDRAQGKSVDKAVLKIETIPEPNDVSGSWDITRLLSEWREVPENKWGKIERLFSFALSISEKNGQRDRFFDDLKLVITTKDLNIDVDIVEEVKSLFKYSETTFLSHISIGSILSLENIESILLHENLKRYEIDDYEILRPIGHGGMGNVYEARKLGQDKPYAVKILNHHYTAFNERLILGMFNHPNIINIIDGGWLSDGRPYIVMPLIHGLPITKYCNQHRMNIRQRLELFLQVCKAIHHAHRKGVLHLDLKPSNIIVDEEAHVTVMDFGISLILGDKSIASKRLTSSLDSKESTINTQVNTIVGSIIGTPAYMAPEQTEADRHQLGTTTDIYGLGSLLYELLCGFRVLLDIDSADSITEMLTMIRNNDPILPSQRLALGIKNDSSHLYQFGNSRRVSRQLRGELDKIIMKALHKSPYTRYQTVDLFMEDLKCYLEGRPISLFKHRWLYRLKKWLARKYHALCSVWTQ